MVMTKKEKAEFDAAIERAETLGALRWTVAVQKDLPAPKEWKVTTSGWDFNIYNCSVRQMWSEVVSHGDGPARNNKYGGSQGGVNLYSTKLLALRALRYAVELEAATKLRKIDALIADEMSVTK